MKPLKPLDLNKQIMKTIKTN